MDRSFRLMPEQASSIAADVDLLYAFLLMVSAVMTVAIATAIIYLAIKYRRNSKANRVSGPAHFLILELSWIIGPLILTMIMFVWGASLYHRQVTHPAGVLEINCVGRQWMWKFQHPDGRGEINDLHVPLGQPVKLNMISDDVIHSVYFPAFRIKQDVLPGRYTSLWFEPSRLGAYHLFCAEYCGTKHSGMRGVVYVMEPVRYQNWLRSQPTDTTTVPESRRLFDQLRCGSCHLGGGQQSRGPVLHNIYGNRIPLQDGRVVVADNNYLRESILNPKAKIVAGYQPLMPSFEGQVSEEGILQLINEIKAMSQLDAVEISGGRERTGPDQIPPLDEPQKSGSEK